MTRSRSSSAISSLVGDRGWALFNSTMASASLDMRSIIPPVEGKDTRWCGQICGLRPPGALGRTAGKIAARPRSGLAYIPGGGNTVGGWFPPHTVAGISRVKEATLSDTDPFSPAEHVYGALMRRHMYAMRDQKHDDRTRLWQMIEDMR